MTSEMYLKGEPAYGSDRDAALQFVFACLLVTGIATAVKVLNVIGILISLWSIAAKIFPDGAILNVASIAVTGLSICGDILLIISAGTKATQTNPIRTGGALNVPPINPMGTDGALKNTLKMMLWALCIKVFVIIFDFFTSPMYSYNCYLDCIRKLGKWKKWEDYLKGKKSMDTPSDGAFWVPLSVLFTTITTAIKVVILYFIHDFYEGVKQQGSLDSNGLLDVNDWQRQQMQAVDLAIPVSYGGMMAPGAPMSAAYPTAGMMAPGAPMQGVYPVGGMMNPGGALGMGYYPTGGMMAQPGALGPGTYPAGGMMAQPGTLGPGSYPAAGMMAQPGTLGPGSYPAGNVMLQPGAPGQESQQAGGMATPGAPTVTHGNEAPISQSKMDAVWPLPTRRRSKKGSVTEQPRAKYPRDTD
ncbi:uncharacterized protein [Dermacentor albipictus]|uniref:uncharacterized protein isoform X2 n=1 Tax=Dermacentor albipictus TaxID=60249 RepID=UPI0038FD266F